MTQKVAKRKFYATSGTQKQNGTRRDKDYNVDKNYKSSSEEKPAAIAQDQSKLSTEMRLKQEGNTLVQDAILCQKQDSLISNQWEINDKKRREQAMLLQQGSVRYTREAKALKPYAAIIDEDKEFYFNTSIPANDHYLDFRSRLLEQFQKKTVEEESDCLPSGFKIAKKELAKKGKRMTMVQKIFLAKQMAYERMCATKLSDEAKNLNKLFNSVGQLNDELEMSLVTNRDRLKPFVDEGVVHKDRKREVKRYAEDGQKPKNHVQLEERITILKNKISDLIKDKNIGELKDLIVQTADLADDPDNDYVISSVRMYIIHA